MVFEFVPQKLIYGGDALGYHGGRPVLVPRVLPGERIEVEEVRTAKGVKHARPLRILGCAPERTDPPCPYFGRCGGCQYQHLNGEAQTETKREILRETLRHIGKITWQAEIPVHAAHPWNYRNQAELKVAPESDGRVALGFFEAESHRLVAVDSCPLLSPRLNAILRELREPRWSERLADCGEIHLLADHRDEEVMLTLHGKLSPETGEALAQDCLAQLQGVVTVAVGSGLPPHGAAGRDATGVSRGRRAPAGSIAAGRGWMVFGKPALTYRVGEFGYQISPGSFFQASRFLLPELVRAAVAPAFSPAATLVDGKTASGIANPRLALDLFAGVGLFTLPLASCFAEVVAVESSAASAADLAANARARGFTHIRVVKEPVFDFLRRFAQIEPDLAVLDPPRAGVGAKTLEMLTRLRPRRIHYVSCSPPTLARDLECLVRAGYELTSIEMFDFFPQTYHIECLARLVRGGEASRP